MLGVIRYDSEGLPICEICGKSFNRVIAHARQKHNTSERDYKKQFGLDLKKGICSASSKQKSKQKVQDNWDKCVSGNLIKGGIDTRFKEGDKGRTKEQVSTQTLIRLTDQIKSIDKDHKIKTNNCRKLGLSGLGNKTRWNKK